MPKVTGSVPLENFCNATAIRRASRRITQFYDGMLETTGLRSTQLAILFNVSQAGDEPIMMGELADSLTLDRSALGHNLRPLVRDGFLKLKKSNYDRREIRVVLTPSGDAKCREARSLWEKAQNAFETELGPAKAMRLRKLMLEIARSDVFDKIER